MNWLDSLTYLKAESQSHVLMTVLDVRGSSPRDAGAKMVVTADQVYDTIGGGALEYRSIKIARQLLEENRSAQHTETFHLGKDLKQCCGGVVSVFFEVFPASDFVVNIFGAGHIGESLCKVLSDIDCTVNVFDSRVAYLQSSYPTHISARYLDKPELIVESCTPNSYFLVMTHDHALDQQLVEAVLARGDFAYCGLIGSRSKRIKFRRRLREKGFSDQELSGLTCPMGLNELHTKKPMEIAVSVIAEILMLRNRQQSNGVLFDTEANIVRLESVD